MVEAWRMIIDSTFNFYKTCKKKNEESIKTYLRKTWKCAFQKIFKKN